MLHYINYIYYVILHCIILYYLRTLTTQGVARNNIYNFHAVFIKVLELCSLSLFFFYSKFLDCGSHTPIL